MRGLAAQPVYLSHKFAAFGLLAACLVLGQAQRSAAQSNMAYHSMGVRDAIPPSELPVPQKLTGIGNVHLHITATPEGQMWFDQGLNLLHDFWDYESARAFEQSVRADPQCAMCYWGLYKAEMFTHSLQPFYADQSLDKAIALAKHASKAERLYISASAAHQEALKAAKEPPDFSKEVELWRKLVKAYPRDTQARIFLAEAVADGYDDSGKPRDGQKEALEILRGVLKDEPENSAANHYWIHAVEDSAEPEQGLRSAGILASLAPSSGHMVHMPGHIYYRLGDYAQAQKSFAASTDADESYMKSQQVNVDNDWNYAHNLMYAIANLMEEGQLNEATALAIKLARTRGDLETTLYPWSARDSISRINPRLPVALRTGDWGLTLELLKENKLPAGLTYLKFLGEQLMNFAAGMQALESHDLAKAQEASQRLDAELWRISQGLKDTEAAKGEEKKPDNAGPPKLQVMPDALPKPLVANLSIMSLELRAGLLAAKKQTSEAKEVFAQAAQEEKALGYREPPGYIRPVAEAEAAALMAAGDWGDAKAAYLKALVERPKSGFPLYGIAMSSERAGDANSATAEYLEFVAAWKNADSDLAQLAHARGYLAEHQASVAGR
jgi:tetratricopeptide (TPR) repeat protein